MEVYSMCSEKDKLLLVVNGSKFYKAAELHSGNIKWRCVKKLCVAKLYTDLKNSIISCDLQHNHEINHTTLVRQQLNNSVKRKAQKDPTERPAKLINMELKNHPDYMNHIDEQDIGCIRRNMYKARRSNMPALPRNVVDVHDVLNKKDIYTVKEERFLLVNDPESNIVMFSCFTNLHFLCSVDVLYMDGTFQYCTKFFYQFFSIHALYNNQYIPLVFILLPDKKTCTYSRMFTYLIENRIKYSLYLNPKKIIVDFEKGIHEALYNNFPNAIVNGCLFHLTQAWYRKILQLHLSNQYKDNNSEVGQWLQHLFGLPFLSPAEISDCFAFDFMPIQPNDDNLKLFTDYLVDNYVSEDGTFPPHMWAEMTSSMTRSTNACESFHSHFNQQFYSSHPPIFSFVDTLLNIQINTYLKIKSAKLSHKKPRNCIRKKKLFLEMQINNYKNNKISRFQFVKNISHKYQP